MNKEKKTLIVFLVVVVYLLALVGVLMSFSISFAESEKLSINLFIKQLAYVGIGTVVLVFFSFFNHHKLRGLAKTIFLLLFIILNVLLFKGFEDLHRWIPLGLMAIQPSQYTYLILSLLIARIFSGPLDDKKLSKLYLASYLIIAIVSGLIVFEPDMGSGIITFLSSFALLFVSGMPLYEFLTFSLLGASGIALVLPLSAEWSSRLKAWRNPYAYQTGDALQMLQSIRAFARGGITGVGFMRSLLKFPGYLPVSSSDFVYAIIGEEIGLFGCTLLIVLYVIIAFIGLRVAKMAKSTFSMLLAFGLTIGLISWAVVNMAVNVGLMPVTGVPLPFVSFGGNNMIANFASTGILINIIRKEVG